MASFDAINYSLRPSKSVQRHLVFDGLCRLSTALPVRSSQYVGFGSVWFTDFLMAHRLLGIGHMVSIEADEIGYRRALYNKPYSMINVVNGFSGEVLADFVNPECPMPVIAWLDYDYALNESVVTDIRYFVDNAPSNSILIVTVSGLETKYGNAPDRPQRLRELLGPVVPDDLSKNSCKNDRLLGTLGEYLLQYVVSLANDGSRPGAAIPAFNIPYQDGSPMLTIGCVLPAIDSIPAVTGVIKGDEWKGLTTEVIRLPHLTSREVSALQATQPSDIGLSRADVQRLGFDLEQSQIDAYRKYYINYPTYAQVFA